MSWLNDKPIETEPEITFSELKAEYQKGFQAGIDFAVKMIEERDLEPNGVTFACACGKSEFLTDAEAEKKGWSSDKCADCIVKDSMTESPYFSRTIGYAENAKQVKLGGIIVR